MASELDACENDPNFAVICAFLEKFGKQCGLPSIDFLELQQMLENSDEVPQNLTELIIKLLRRVKKTVKPDKWEKALISVVHKFSSVDAWEIERFGYKKAKLSSKVRVLKELLEMQFDYHVKFKNDINKMSATELRSQPLGRDKAGHAYWFHSDENYQIRIYKEDQDDETWTLIAKDREGLVSLINKLSDGNIKSSSDSAVNEDSSSLSEKPVIDTGQLDSAPLDNLEEKDDCIDFVAKSVDKKEGGSEKEQLINEETKSEPPAIPLLRIKKLSELMDSNAKRQKFDVDNADESPNKGQNDSKDDIIVGEEISEPVMKIEGEGNGEDNKSVNEKKTDKFEYSTSEQSLNNCPIVGEELEDVFYFYGEGCGEPCLAGNEDRLPKSESAVKKNTQENHSMDSSRENVVCEDTDNHGKNYKEGSSKNVNIDAKTDNIVDSIDKVDKTSEESISKKESTDTLENENTTDEPSSPVPKKSMFFFGSPLKNTPFPSSAKVEFGQVSPSKQDAIECKSKNDTENIHKDHEIVENKNSEELESKIDNKETTDENKSVNSTESNDEMEHSLLEIENVVDDKGKTEGDRNQETSTDSNLIISNDRKSSNFNENSHVPVEEKLCTKKVAYECGSNVEPYESNTKMNEKENTGLEKQLTVRLVNECNKEEGVEIEKENLKDKEKDIEIEKENSMDKTLNIENTKSCDLEKSREEEEKSKPESESVESSIETGKERDKPVKTQNLKVATKNDGPSKINKLQTNIVKKATTIKDDQLHKSLRYFRTRRSANVNMVQGNTASVKSNNSTVLTGVKTNSLAGRSDKPTVTPKVSTEVVYVQDRKTKSKKEREQMPLISQKNNKKPKLISEVLEQEIQLSKKDYKSDGKTNSSISSPLSITDSIITLPDSLENSCADGPEKDPLADSDVDEKSDPKMSMRSLSFDYNDSSTPPPIPVIPSGRVLRKRGREASPPPTRIFVNDNKKMKMKNKRQINASLRKSIEEKKEQQISSSDEVQIVSENKSPKTTPKKNKKSKSKKYQKKNKPVSASGAIDISDDSEKGTTPKKNEHAKNKNAEDEVVELTDDDSITSSLKQKSKGKNTRILAGLEIDEDIHPLGVRQSRRLAQIKIKEQVEPKKPEPKTPKQDSKKRHEVKEILTDKKKRVTGEEFPQVPDVQEKKRKRKKETVFTACFDERKVWQSSSESSEAEEEVEEEEEVIEEYEPPLEFKSDHEFSPESDSSDNEYQPMKRARTAIKNQESQQEEEDFPCQKCGKSDHPEWILLCDKCDNGWHCSCIRPPLLNIPEGDWHCPPCQHILLVENLQKKLEEYDKQLVKKELEDRRKERLAYVGISLNNVLPTRENEHRKKKRRHSVEDSEESVSEKSYDSYGTGTDSDSDAPIYQLRQRRQAKSYKFNEYDELIKSAIQDEMQEKGHEKAPHSRGKDIATIVNAKEEEKQEDLNQSKGESAPPQESIGAEVKTKEYSDDDDIIKPVKKRGGRRKGRKMTNLDISSEDDDEKDEDFKGTSSSSEEDDLEEEETDDSDYQSKRRKQNLRPTRRSTRVKTSRYDADFINDDEDDDDDDTLRKKKKKRKAWVESSSSDTEGSWGRKKKKGRAIHTKKRKSRKKDSILDELSDLEIKKPKRRIKYGGLTSSEEETGKRRTRGKKTTYVDTLGSDSEEERKKRNPHRYIDSDDENDEDFIANEEDEEKDSEVPEEEDEDKEEEEEEDELQEERRPLIIPKIYIKKPTTTPHINPAKETNESVKSTLPPETKDTLTPETKNNDENKATPVIKDNKEFSADKNFNNISEKPKIESTVTKTTDANAEKLGKPTNAEALGKPTYPEKLIKPTKAAELSKPNIVEELNKPQETQIQLSERTLTNKEVIRRIGDTILTRIEKKKESELIPVTPTKLSQTEIEQEKKRKAIEEAKKLLGSSNSIEIVPIMKPKRPTEEPVKVSLPEPIVDNVNALIQNDESNDELSEPPSVTLPVFEELANKNGTGVRRKIGKGKPNKKTLEEAVANLGGKKDPIISVKSESDLCIEIAAPPQPFSQASPVPSVITRMLQTSPGQTTAFPVGKIRPKQFATMPADDDDEPLPSNRTRGNSPQTAPHYSSPHVGPFLQSGPRGAVNQPYNQMHQNINSYPRGMLSPHQMRSPRPPLPSHLFPHQVVDPLPPGGIPLTVTESSPHPVSSGALSMKVDNQNYPRPPIRYPPISSSSNHITTPSRLAPSVSHIQQLRPSVTSNSVQPPPATPSTGPVPSSYYSNYPSSESVANEEAMSANEYQGSPYQEDYYTDAPGPEASENSNSKSYGESEEGGGEFGGLVSYFSSQREDDLES